MEHKYQYGLLGERLGHSFSPEIHALLGNDDYNLKPMPADEFDRFMTVRDFKGVNVTIPYKERALKFCEARGDAVNIGSVNTVVNTADGLVGYNTDICGLEYMISRAGGTLKDRKVVILGSGGTARCAFYAARKGGAREIVVLSRSGKCEFAEGVANTSACTYDETDRYNDAEVIINTTPVGMYPDSYNAPVSLDIFDSCESVFDVIFNPLETKIVREARKRGLRASNGLPMLVAQAWYANAYFFGLDTERACREEEIEDILATLERKVKNLVLIGMPGSGKSTVGKALADITNREFADSDEEFTKMFNMTPEECIRTYGEAEFRDKETSVILEMMKRTGIVMSTGGGSILREVNRDAMKSNSTIIYLDRKTECLSTAGRPLSKDLDTVHKLFEERKAFYLNLSDIKVTVKEGEVSGTVREICGQLNLSNEKTADC